MPAPKQNNFAIGNSGKPKKWQTVELLERDILDYFSNCDKNVLKKDKEGNITTEPYTIEGLCLALGCDRMTLLNYQKKVGYEEYFDTIKKAKLKIQKQKVVNGMIGLSNPTITIFDLKNNHEYKDQSEINQNISLGKEVEDYE